MAAFSNTLEDEILTSYLVGKTVYLALFTTDPTDAGTGTELTGATLPRRAVTFTAAAAGATSNDADVAFTGMPAATVTHIGLYDAVTGGKFMFHGALTAPKTTADGDTLTFRTGDLVITLD